MFMMSSTHTPATLWSTCSQDAKSLEAVPNQQYVDLTVSFQSDRKKAHLNLPPDSTFRKLEFILCSTLMRLMVSVITFL